MTAKQTRLRSMTGFAAVTAQHNGFLLSVSLRSVNHRYLDLRVHAPDALLPLERKARAIVQERNPRGHVDLKVALESPGGADLIVDETLLARYLETFRRVGTQYGLEAPTDLAALSQLPGVVARKDTAPNLEITSDMEAAFLQAVKQAVERWDRMRGEEAALLVEDMRARIGGLRQTVERLEQWQREALRESQQRFAERLQGLVGQVGIEPARLAQEALMLADRTDTSEEMLRLKAHLAQFAALLDGDADAGRKLDFLLQEMQREANTLLSKVAGLGESSLPLTQAGVEMKAEIEKLREQVQNLQ
jgi:uncharacterized protein (TIGR00255 family)